MAYESISHARSHRAPFAGLGRAPGYMGNYCSDGMAGPSPGDADFMKTLLGSGGGGAKGGGGGGAAAGGANPVAAVANAAGELLKTTSTIIDAASGGYEKRERESRRNLEIARLQASAAGGNAAAQVEIAKLQAEAAIESARLAGQAGDASTKKIMMIGGGIALLAVLGIGAAIALK